MTRSTTVCALIVAAAGTLLLAGCSTDSTDSPAPAATRRATGTTVSVTVPSDIVPAADLPNEPVGSKITVAGEPATVCLYGDSYGTSVWAGGAGTSCGVVDAAYRAMTAGQDETEVLHDQLITEITVADPTSGDEVVMACGPRGEVLTTCLSANGRTVHLY
jgi:hypothetical protein